MAGLLVGSGIDTELREIAADTTNWRIHLYKNNYTPTPGDTVGNYTEADYDGYLSQASGLWTVGGAGPSSNTLTSPQFTFLDTGVVTPNQIYGYYITDGFGVLVAAELFAGGPYAFTAAGIGIQLTIVQTMSAP